MDPAEGDLRALRLAVQIMLISLIILSGALGLYLYRQVVLLNRQAKASNVMARQMAQNFNVNVATQAMLFEKSLRLFASTNPAFNAQIAKYFVTTSSPPFRAGSLPTHTPPAP